MSLREVTFLCYVPAMLCPDRATEGPEVLVNAQFKLGLGPCGLFIHKLSAVVQGENLVVTQVAYPFAEIPECPYERARFDAQTGARRMPTATEAAHYRALMAQKVEKRFTYKMSDIQGRIAMTVL